jgi:hypothetical protein
MSNSGLFAARFNNSTNSLRRFDEALRYFKRLKIQKDSPETRDQMQKLLFVLEQISASNGAQNRPARTTAQKE